MALTQVIKQLHKEQKRLQVKVAQIDSALTALNGVGAKILPFKKKRRRMSIAARKRIARAQRARWKKQKAA